MCWQTQSRPVPQNHLGSCHLRSERRRMHHGQSGHQTDVSRGRRRQRAAAGRLGRTRPSHYGGHVSGVKQFVAGFSGGSRAGERWFCGAGGGMLFAPLKQLAAAGGGWLPRMSCRGCRVSRIAVSDASAVRRISCQLPGSDFVLRLLRRDPDRHGPF